MSARTAVIAVVCAAGMIAACKGAASDATRAASVARDAAAAPTTPTPTPAPAIPPLSGLFACQPAACAAIAHALQPFVFDADKAAIAKLVGNAIVDRVDELDVEVGSGAARHHVTLAMSGDGKLVAVDQHVDAATLAAFGPPLSIDATTRGWFSPAARLRVIAAGDAAGETRVRFERDTPLAALLTGLLARPMLGKTRVELDATYPDFDSLDHDGETYSPDLLAVETARQHVHLDEEFDAAGKLARYTLALPFGRGPAADAIARELLAQVGASLGAPTLAIIDGGTTRYRFGGPNATIVELATTPPAIDWKLTVRSP